MQSAAGTASCCSFRVDTTMVEHTLRRRTASGDEHSPRQAVAATAACSPRDRPAPRPPPRPGRGRGAEPPATAPGAAGVGVLGLAFGGKVVVAVAVGARSCHRAADTGEEKKKTFWIPPHNGGTRGGRITECLRCHSQADLSSRSSQVHWDRACTVRKKCARKLGRNTECLQ